METKGLSGKDGRRGHSYEPEGRVFESRRAHHLPLQNQQLMWVADLRSSVAIEIGKSRCLCTIGVLGQVCRAGKLAAPVVE